MNEPKRTIVSLQELSSLALLLRVVAEVTATVSKGISEIRSHVPCGLAKVPLSVAQELLARWYGWGVSPAALTSLVAEWPASNAQWLLLPPPIVVLDAILGRLTEPPLAWTNLSPRVSTYPCLSEPNCFSLREGAWGDLIAWSSAAGQEGHQIWQSEQWGLRSPCLLWAGLLGLIEGLLYNQEVEKVDFSQGMKCLQLLRWEPSLLNEDSVEVVSPGKMNLSSPLAAFRRVSRELVSVCTRKKWGDQKLRMNAFVSCPEDMRRLSAMFVKAGEYVDIEELDLRREPEEASCSELDFWELLCQIPWRMSKVKSISVTVEVFDELSIQPLALCVEANRANLTGIKLSVDGLWNVSQLQMFCEKHLDKLEKLTHLSVVSLHTSVQDRLSWYQKNKSIKNQSAITLECPLRMNCFQHLTSFSLLNTSIDAIDFCHIINLLPKDILTNLHIGFNNNQRRNSYSTPMYLGIMYRYSTALKNCLVESKQQTTKNGHGESKIEFKNWRLKALTISWDVYHCLSGEATRRRRRRAGGRETSNAGATEEGSLTACAFSSITANTAEIIGSQVDNLRWLEWEGICWCSGCSNKFKHGVGSALKLEYASFRFLMSMSPNPAMKVCFDNERLVPLLMFAMLDNVLETICCNQYLRHAPLTHSNGSVTQLDHESRALFESSHPNNVCPSMGRLCMLAVNWRDHGSSDSSSRNIDNARLYFQLKYPYLTLFADCPSKTLTS
eukprot:Nk52_evm4s2297 gene=Nk52_evmTU4s2297